MIRNSIFFDFFYERDERHSSVVLHNRSISLLLYDDDELFSGLHLTKYFPLTPFTVGEVAKNTLVSAPFLIEIAPIFFARFSPIPTIPVLFGESIDIPMDWFGSGWTFSIPLRMTG